MHYFKYLFFALKRKYPQIKLYLQDFFYLHYVLAEAREKFCTSNFAMKLKNGKS